jgi:hypothetical protein
MAGYRLPLVLSLLLIVFAGVACTLENATGGSKISPDLQTRPLVLILAPANGNVYAEGVAVQFHAIAQDSLAGVARIEFRMDDLLVGEARSDDPNGQPSLEAQTTWTAADKRGHVLTVEAFRANGSSLGLADVTLKVTDRPGTLPSGGGAPPTFTPAGVPTMVPTLTPSS